MSRATNISAQVAAKAAGYLFQGTGNTEDAMKAMARIYTGIITLGGAPEEDNPIPQGQAPLANAPIAQAQTALAQGGVQATVARDLSDEDARWQDAIVNYPKDWYNNVGDAKASSGGGKGPDFRFKKESADIKSLWLNGQYGPAPAWVFEKLGLQFPGTVQTIAQGNVPATPAPQATYGPGEAPF